jgi:hypothetical protein
MTSCKITAEKLTICHDPDKEDNDNQKITTLGNNLNQLPSDMIAPFYKTMLHPKFILTTSIEELQEAEESLMKAYEDSKESPLLLIDLLTMWFEIIIENHGEKVTQYINSIPRDILYFQEWGVKLSKEEKEYVSTNEIQNIYHKEISVITPVLNYTWSFSKMLYDSSVKVSQPIEILICRYVWLHSDKITEEEIENISQLDNLSDKISNPIQEIMKWEPFKEQLDSNFEGGVTTYNSVGLLSEITTPNNNSIKFYTVYMEGKIDNEPDTDTMTTMAVSVEFGEEVSKETKDIVTNNLDTIQLNYMVNENGHTLTMFPSNTCA